MGETVIKTENKITFPWRLAVIFILFSTGIILLGIYYYESQKKRIFKEEENNLSAIASLKIGQIERWRKERLGDAIVFSQDKPLIRSLIQFYSGNNQELKKELTDWMKSVRNEYDYLNVLIADTSFRVRLSVNPSDSVIGDSLKKEMKKALKDDSIVFTDLHRSEEIPSIHLDILIPLVDSISEKKITVGIAMLRIDPYKVLFPIIQTWPTLSKSSETLLLRKESDSVLFLNELRHAENTALRFKLPLTNKSLLAMKAVNGSEGLTEGTDYRNIPVVGSIHKVPGMPWYMVAKVDKKEILSPLKKYVFLIILIVVLLILMNASIFGFWIWQQRVKFYRNQLKNEVSLRESEMKFRQTFDLSPIGIVMVGLDKRFIRCNNAFSHSLGFKMEELVGKNLVEVTYPDDIDIGMSEMAGIAKGEIESSHVQKRYLHKDGQIVWGDVLISLIRNTSGDPLYFLAIIQDITESKEIVEALRESEDKFKYVFDHSLIGKSITLPSGEISVNKAFCDMLGYEPEELKKINWADISHPDDIEQNNNSLNLILSGKKDSARFTKRYIHKNGSVIWADVGTSLRRDANNNPQYFMTSVNDISERKRADDELRIQSEIMSHMAEAVYLVRMKDGIIVYTNPRFEELFGYEPGEMILKHVSIVNAPTVKSPDQTAAEIMNDLDRKGYWAGEVLNIKKDGTVFWSHANVTIFDHSKFGKVLVSVQQDITERKNAESQIKKLNEELEGRVAQRTELLEAANKELEAFSYSVSHDLRAPLRSVHGYTKILMEEYENLLDEEGKRICGIISSSATQMGELIDDLLSFSRIGRTSMNRSMLDMRSMALSVFQEISSSDDKSRIELKMGSLHKAYVDANLLKMVWNNLISNAVKYTSKEKLSEITIDSVLRDHSITYSVKDNGVGFDMNYKHKLFGVFQRLHSESEFEGNGVGLAIVQRIILKHGGEVWAEGEVGKGATFYFSLPLNGTGS